MQALNFPNNYDGSFCARIIGKDFNKSEALYIELCIMEYSDEELFSLNLRRILRTRGWTQKDLSKITGIDTGDISKLINGKDAFTVYRVSLICQMTGIEVNEFYRDDIYVINNCEHISVYLVGEVVEEKPKRIRPYTYERLIYKFTAKDFEEVKQKYYDKGFADGMKAAKGICDENNGLMKVAEDDVCKAN